MSKLKGGGKGRTISSVKRNNQKRQKLIKKGKLKPKSASEWQKKHMIKAKTKEGQKKEPVKNGHVQKDDGGDYDDDEEEEQNVEELMSMEEAQRLWGQEQKGMAGYEVAALKRLEEAKANKKQRPDEPAPLLPIKTKKDGVVWKHQKAQDDESEDGDKSEDDDVDMEEGDKEEDKPDEPRQPESHSVISLLSKRAEMLSELKLSLGSMANNFLVAPEDRIYVLEKMVSMLTFEPSSPLVHTGFKLVAATLLELFKDVIPNYKIQEEEEEEEVMHKKETRRLKTYEKTLLQCAKKYLMQLEQRLKHGGRELRDSPQGGSAGFSLQCLCDLLAAHPHFNFAPNIVHLIVPLLDHQAAHVRQCVLDSTAKVFRADKRGEITCTIVANVKKFMKVRKYVCRPELVACLLPVKLSAVAVKAEEEQADDGGGKKKHHKQLSKKEKKQQKSLEKVKRELLESKGEESKRVRQKYNDEAARAIFEVLFRAIKSSTERPHLLRSTMDCISKFCHTINIDLVSDLLSVMTGLVQNSDGLPTDVRLVCIRTAFDILTGPGECLTYDPGQLVRALHEMLPSLDLNRPDLCAAVCSVVRSVLVKRRKLVSRDLVQELSKTLAFTALQLTSVDELALVLDTLKAVKSAHVSSFLNLLTAEESIPSKVPRLGQSWADVGTRSLWELSLLQRHHEPKIVAGAMTILNTKDFGVMS